MEKKPDFISVDEHGVKEHRVATEIKPKKSKKRGRKRYKIKNRRLKEQNELLKEKLRRLREKGSVSGGVSQEKEAGETKKAVGEMSWREISEEKDRLLALTSVNPDDRERFIALLKRGDELLHEARNEGHMKPSFNRVAKFDKELKKLQTRQSEGKLEKSELQRFQEKVMLRLRLLSTEGTARELADAEFPAEYVGINEHMIRVGLEDILSETEALTPVDKAKKKKSKKEKIERLQRRTNKLLEKLTETRQEGSDAGSVLKEIVKTQEQMAEFIKAISVNFEAEAEMRKLQRYAYGDFVDNEKKRLYVNPETFAQQKPLWYRALKKEEQQNAVLTRVNVNFIAANIRYNGMVNLDGCINIPGAQITKEGLRDCLDEVPGYRLVMATMIRDLFKPEEDHFVISENGYKHLETDEAFRKYKAKIKKEILKELSNGQQNGKSLMDKWGTDKLEDLADAAIASVDNLLYATGVYDSADEELRLKNNRAWSEQIRAMMMPGRKGIRKKWIKGKDKDRPDAVPPPEGTEEGWGGPLGEWMRDRAYNDPEFRKKLFAGEINYIPQRMLYSMFDHTTTNIETGEKDQDGKPIKMTLAQQMLKAANAGGTEVNSGLCDLEPIEIKTQDGKITKYEIDFMSADPDDLYGSYADIRDSVVKIYKHLTSSDPRDRMGKNKLIDSLNKAVRGRLLEGLYVEEDLVIACIAMGISPDGLVEGSTDMILKLDPKTFPAYDHLVCAYLNDERWYSRMKGAGFRERVIKSLHANDVYTWRGIFASMGELSFFGKREKDIIRAKEQKRKALEEEERLREEEERRRRRQQESVEPN